MLTHRTDIQMRFGDTDALGHINNASFATYAELGRLDFLSKLGGSVRSLILASLYIDFRRQVNLGDHLYVASSVSKLGRTSVTLEQAIYANDEKAADVKSVVVHFDYATNKPKELSEAIRAVLAQYVGREEG